ncbi:apolipophorins isoform X1 [Cydia amplana]|uniref:apolipophorins isoform X1 n=1 Tax=Cydia amplana TaxID=1869771 RepID=UPI002FE61535
MGPSLSWNIFSVLLIVSVLWKPAFTDDKCNVGCQGSPSGPTFLNGHKYNYGVEGTVSIYLTGADKQETSVKLLGQVSVAVLGNCAHVLRVQNLVISGPDGKKYNKPPGLEKPVRFTLQDGRVGAEICAEEGDTRRSLNIKRAIISLLQTEQKSSSQVDVFGACPTDASSSQEGGAVLVHRTRDLSRCTHREQGQNNPVYAVASDNAQIADTQVLQSILNVESKVNNGVPEKVSATEEYLYRPFSVGENGARSKVHTKLTLTGKSAGADAGAFTQVRTIIFENPHGVASEQSNYQAALAQVKETAKTCGSEASSKSAGNFAQLVRILKPTSKDDLVKIFNAVKGNSLEKRVFIDGLLRTGTGNSIEASIQILKQKELDALEQQIVFLSLGNAQHVNTEALKAATSLLDLPNIPKDTYLGVGALAGYYCRSHECHHKKNEGIIALSAKLAAKLGGCKAKSKLEEDTIVAVLKGIRNIRHLEDILIDKIVHCAVDPTIKNRVKAAALEAFQADPCSAKIKKTALDLLKNTQLDSEIRIKAYQAVIQCPCGKSASEIKKLLDNEPVHQVGRYITTSLRHIRASANPDKRHAREHYGQIRTPNRFNVDDRKYSFYREASYNIDALGVGGNVEQSVIYSQNSFLPRSASLNLTTEVFGHNFNLLEIGGRQGNLDRVVEHFLGPRSFLRTEDPQSLYDDLKKRFKEAEDKVNHGVRGRRSIKTEIDSFDNRVKAESNSYHNELDLDIYVKLFGTDAIFLSLGDEKGFDFNHILDQIVHSLSDGINKVKHFQKEIHANALFLDAELVYPTSTGFPLKLDLIGAATARIDIATNVDIRQILRNPESAKVDIKLVPSTDIEISGLFLVDADAVSTGLKVITNLHSSTGGHLIAKVLENGHGIDLQFALPIDKQEILTASNDLVYYTAEKGQQEKHIPIKIDADRKDYSGCFDQLSGLIGLTFCGEVSVPFTVSGPEAQNSISKFLARYPLTGASKVKIVVEKNDLRGYHIKGIVRGDNPERRSFELLFEAEGGKSRRAQVSGELVNNQQEKTIKLALDSPIKKAGGQVSIYTKPSEYVLLVKANLDNEQYYARAGFNVQGNEQRSVFKPVAEYELPGGKGKQSLKVDGQLVREVNGPKSKYTLEGIKISLPNNEVVDITGHYVHEPNSCEIDLKAKKGEHNVILGGSLKGHDFKLEFQNTLNAFVNFKASGHTEWSESVIHNDLDLLYGGDLRDQRNRVTFNQLLKHHTKPSEFSLITKNKFEVHSLPIKVKFDGEVDPKKVDIVIEGQYIDKKAEFELEARTQIKHPGDYSVKLIANADKNGIEVFAKRDIVSADKSNLENYIAVKNIGKYELSGVVTHKNKPNDVHLGAVGHLKIAGGGKNEDITFDLGVIDNNNLYSSHAKIAYSKGAILDWLLKVTKGANAKGELKLILKDTISANGQFAVTDADGKGNGAVLVDFKNVGRKIKADVKFQVKNPVYNADVDVFLNFEKDNKDKVSFSTKTKTTEKLVDSKNKLDYAGKRTELNVNVNNDINAQAAGKTAALIEIVLPTERLLSLKLDRDITFKDDVYNGHAEIILADAVKRGGATSEISYKSKLNNCNFKKDIYHYEGELGLSLKDGKQLKNTFFIKNQESGDKGKLELKSDISGNLIPHPASLSGSIDYTNPDSLEGSDNYRLKGSYGNDIGFDLDGKFELQVTGEGDKKYLDESTVSFRLPFEKAHDIKIVSNWLWLVPQSKSVYLEYSSVQSVQVNADVYKFDANGKVGPKNGFTKVKVLVPHVDPLSLDFNYKADLEGEKKTGSAEVKAVYGKGKSANIAVDASAAQKEYAVKIRANTPQNDQLKKLELSINSKNPSPDTLSSIIIVDADGRVYKTESLVVYSKSHPLLDVKYTNPNSPKTSRIYLKGEYPNQHQGKAEIKVENIKDVSFDVVSEAQIQNNDINLKTLANSDALGWKNYNVQIVSKDAGSGKRLEFHATNAGKNILSGSTSFISKQEGPKTIIEGSGSVKVKDEQKSANFKYIRTLLTEGNEQGVETFLNLAIGERSYVAESRVTNLEYKNSYVYCEEKKQCANAELHSKINVQKPGVFQHTFNLGVDLRKLGFAPEFGLQINNEVSERKLPQYSLDLHINKEDKKYHLHVYSTPDQGKYPAGVTLTLPTRVLALESVVSYPTDKALPFPIQGHIELHPDKNKPQHKAAARFRVDVTGADKSHSAVAELGFSHPKLGKEAVIKVKGGFHTPAENTVKFESSASISHPTLGNDRETKILLEASPSLVKLLVDTPLVKVIDLEAKSELKENLQRGDLKVSLLQGKPVIARFIIQDFQYYEFTTGYSDDNGRRLTVVGHIEPEKRVDISADIVLPNQKKNIIHGALYLDGNLVKSEYGVSKENFNYFVNALKNDLATLENRIKELGEKASKDFKDTLKRVEPTAKNIEKSFEEELSKLNQEIANDKVLRDTFHFLGEIYIIIARTIEDIVKSTKPLVDQTYATLKETCQKIEALYEKNIEPQLKQLYQTAAALVREYLDGLIDLVAHFAALVTDFFEKHKAELQELTNTIAEIFKDLTRLAVAQLKEFRVRAGEICSAITQQIKELPFVQTLKESWQELAVPEQVIGLLNNVYNAIQDVVPTPEAKAFIEALHNYVQKKLKQEKCDDAKEIRQIYEKFAVALTSLVQFVRGRVNAAGVPGIVNLNPTAFFTAPGRFSAPSISGVASFSLLNQFLRGDVPDALALLRAYRPRSLNPLDEIPAKLRAVVVNGQHIFTFDGRHLTFPGNCRYVLAHDYVDRNFTLAIQLQNGNPKALILEHQDGKSIELKDNGQVMYNGAAHGFPVWEKDVYAYKMANGRIGLGSRYGIAAYCTNKLQACYIEVSGFYLGKLRGLLGDGNNEPYDDFRLPNGKITTSESEFGNAYKLASSCAAVKTPEHSAHQHHAALPAACETVFGGASPLRPLSVVLDAAPFRQACIHAVTGDGANALHQACDLGRGYAILALTGLLPAVLPPACVQCTDADKPRTLGESYELKVPKKQADIIVTFETTKPTEKSYKELAVPLVSQLVDTLKAKKIDDIKIYLTGITPQFPYPVIYDTDLKLKNAKVQFNDESRAEHVKHIVTGCEKADQAQRVILDLVEEFKRLFGLTNVVAGYHSVLELPLRPGAVKHAINVVGEHCKPQDLLVRFFQSQAFNTLFAENAYTHTLITVTEGLQIGGGKSPDQIVGWTDEAVLLLGDKKQSRESEQLRQSLDIRRDSCIEFAESTDGITLSSTNYLKLNPGQQKQFLQTAAGAITHKLLAQNLIQDCTCGYADPFLARSFCVNKSRKEASRRNPCFDG